MALESTARMTWRFWKLAFQVSKMSRKGCSRSIETTWPTILFIDSLVNWVNCPKWIAHVGFFLAPKFLPAVQGRHHRLVPSSAILELELVGAIWSQSSTMFNHSLWAITHRIHGAGIYANMTGVYWWDLCYHIYHTWILWVLPSFNLATPTCPIPSPSSCKGSKASRSHWLRRNLVTLGDHNPLPKWLGKSVEFWASLAEAAWNSYSAILVYREMWFCLRQRTQKSRDWRVMVQESKASASTVFGTFHHAKHSGRSCWVMVWWIMV